MPMNRWPQNGGKSAAGARFLNRSGETRPPAGGEKLAQLRAFAKAEFGVEALQPWDIAYCYSESKAAPVQHRR